MKIFRGQYNGIYLIFFHFILLLFETHEFCFICFICLFFFCFFSTSHLSPATRSGLTLKKKKNSTPKSPHLNKQKEKKENTKETW